MYVTEYEGYCVSVFTTSGKFVHQFGSAGSKRGQFDHPYGITFDRNGFLYVSDRVKLIIGYWYLAIDCYNVKMAPSLIVISIYNYKAPIWCILVSHPNLLCIRMRVGRYYHYHHY